jgi:hypothetical protein
VDVLLQFPARTEEILAAKIREGKRQRDMQSKRRPESPILLFFMPFSGVLHSADTGNNLDLNFAMSDSKSPTRFYFSGAVFLKRNGYL